MSRWKSTGPGVAAGSWRGLPFGASSAAGNSIAPRSKQVTTRKIRIWVDPVGAKAGRGGRSRGEYLPLLSESTGQMSIVEQSLALAVVEDDTQGRLCHGDRFGP